MDKKIEVIAFCLILFFALMMYALAASFNCTIVANTSCTDTTGNITVLYMENDSGGYYNAHAQNVSVAVSSRYNYAICCNITGDTLTRSCSDTTFLRIYNETNTHIQQPQVNTSNIPVCMSAATGTISCSYPSSCPSSQACLASMASSNASDNTTNAHIGPCSEYATKICCGLNSPPSITTPILNSTLGTNKTSENLTVYTTSSDADGDSVRLIYNWYINNLPLTLLNLPFENGNSNSTWTKDYALGNNGSVSGATFNSIGGWNAKGAYEFDGVNDYIEVAAKNVLNDSMTQLTVVGWMYANTAPSSGGGLFSNTILRHGCVYYANENVSCYINNIGNNVSYPAGTGAWHHIAETFDGTTIVLYIDGVNRASKISSEPSTGSGGTFKIGYFSGYFNGTIDEVQIWNKSLSAEQIKALYANRTDRIVSQETTKGEVWRVDATPNDGTQDGTTRTSNNLTILNSAPTVSLVSPADNNVTTNRTPAFTWTGIDDDSESLTYTLNLTCYLTSGGTDSIGNQYIESISPTSYTLTQDLKCLQDNNRYYNWTVRANDGTVNSLWATPRRIDIAALIDIFMVNNTVNFGAMNISESRNTTTNNPYPLVIRNNGNCFVNVSVNATKLWLTGDFPGSNYRFKIDNKTLAPAELGAFNWPLSLTSWTNMPNTNTTAIIALNYSDDRDEAEIDILISVPASEPPTGPGETRLSTINFTAALGE